MYKNDDGQISIEEFLSPFGQLDQSNRWVKEGKGDPLASHRGKVCELV